LRQSSRRRFGESENFKLSFLRKPHEKGENPLSHIVEVQTQVNDAEAVRSACQRLKLPSPTRGTFRLFSGEVSGLGVQLPGWRYPAVFNTETGQAHYDTFNGRWGEVAELHKFLLAYACEKVRSEARTKGHMVTEQQLDNGSIKLTVHVGGAI
jgi:hypothetical protein